MNVIPGGVSSSQGGGMYSLKWNQFESCMSLGLAELLEDEEYSMTDVTLACEGEFIQAHKIALAMSSPFFKQFFKMNRVEKAGITLIALANVKFKALKNIIRFIYHGQVQLSNGDLTDFLAAANLLKIRGLEQPSNTQNNDTSTFKATPASSSKVAGVRPPPPISSDLNSSMKRPRLSGLPPAPTDIIPQVHVSLPSGVSTSAPPSSSLEDYSSMHSFNEGDGEEEEEAMISYDDVKVENIAVYTPDDHHQDDGSYQDLTGGSRENTSETVAACDKIEISYPEPSFPIIQYESSPHHKSVGPSHFAANCSLGLGTSSGPSTGSSASRNHPVPNAVPPSAPDWGAPFGRCKFCTSRTKTVSRTKCHRCQEYLCAKSTCRITMKLNGDASRVPVCYNCVKLVDGTPLPFVARKPKAKKVHWKVTPHQ